MRKNGFVLPVVVLLAAALFPHTSGSEALAGPSAEPEIRLVLQVTVDGLRADRLSRYGDRFGKGGFRRLLEKGVVFTNAHYQHANTEIIVSHIILAQNLVRRRNRSAI